MEAMNSENDNIRAINLQEIVIQTEKPFTGELSLAPIFSLVGNERYFLPHFLNHYRRLGISEFHFLVERSDDGTLEYLLEQSDCAVLTSPHQFGDCVKYQANGKTKTNRFANVVRVLAMRQYFLGRWCLILDADEFLVLPENTPSIVDLIETLQKHRLTCCRALMVDFFPQNLEDLLNVDRETNPFEAAPFYDELTVEWPAGEPEPTKVGFQRGIRARMAFELARRYPDRNKLYQEGVPTRLYKTPLLQITPGTQMGNPHKTNHHPSNQVQCVLAHFKFHPGWEAKVRNAVAEGQYMNGSAKYQPLAHAIDELEGWPMPDQLSSDSRINPITQSAMVFNQLNSDTASTDTPKTRGIPQALKTITWQEPNRKNLLPLHIADRGARYSTVTGVAWLDEFRFVANHRNGLRVALFDLRVAANPVVTAELPNASDTVAVKQLDNDTWEVATSDCWHGMYTKLKLDLKNTPSFKRLITRWDNNRTFCHGVAYDSSGRLWLAMMTGADPRIEIDGEAAWRLPKPWGCREVCFDTATGAAYAIAVSDTPKKASYKPVVLRIYSLPPDSNRWSLFTSITNVHADSGAVYNNRLWINDQYADRVIGINLTNPQLPLTLVKTPQLSFPHGVAVSPKGVLAVTNYGTSSISFVDLKTLKMPNE